MEVEYVGPFPDGVDVPMPDGRYQHVPHGGTLKTTREHAEALLEQPSNWRLAPKKKPSAAAAANQPATGQIEEVPGADR